MSAETNGLFNLNDKYFVFINRNFSAIGQLNKPFSAIVINDDAVAVTFPLELEFTKRSNQIGVVIFICVHSCIYYAMVCNRYRPHTTAGWLFKGKLTYVEVCVIIVILIFIDEVHHFLIGSLALLDVHLLTPIIDSIFEGGVDVITSIFKWFSAGTDCYLFREEVTFIVHIINLTATFTDSV